MRIEETNKVKVRGVTLGIWPRGCGFPGLPQIFGDVLAVLDWINKETDGCNQKTCNIPGVCMKADKLGAHTKTFYMD